MQIVCLDGHTLNPGDLSWERVEALGDLTVYDHTTTALLVERAQDADILLTNKVALARASLEQLPKLKLIGVLATGYNVVDVQAARERDIPVCNVPAYGTASVAQMVFAQILNFAQHVAHHAGTVKDGRWARTPHFCYWDYPLVELSGLTMGVVGYGRIGRATAALAQAFGMQVLVYKAKTGENDTDVTPVDLDTLFRQSDFISLHIPLTPVTRGMVNADLLATMKKTAFIINTSRGEIVDEAALSAALERGQIAGAGLDVLMVEPAAPDNPLLGIDTCVITPHIAWATTAARTRLMNAIADNIAAFIAGMPINVIN